MAKNTDTLIECKECKNTKIFTEFYQNNNRLYKGNGVYPICKKCISQIYEGLIGAYGDIYYALIHLCIMMTIPFNRDIAERMIVEDNPVLSVDNYIYSVTKKQPRNGFGFSDENNIERIKEFLIDKKEEQEELDFKITQEMKLRWGSSYSVEEIMFLEKIYNDLIDYYGGEQMTARSLYCDYAQNELLKKQAREQGRDDVVIKYQTAQSKLMADARLKPVQETKSDDDDYLVGLFIKNIEENQPVPEAEESFKDVDGIRKIIRDEYIKTLKRSIGGVLK